MPTRIEAARATGDLNAVFVEAGRPDLALSSDAWVERARTYRAESTLESFLADALAPVAQVLEAADVRDADRFSLTERAVSLLADIWDAARDHEEEGPTAREILDLSTAIDAAATHPGFLRAVADMSEAALLSEEPGLLRVPQEWAELVLRYLPSNDVGSYGMEAVYEPLLGAGEADAAGSASMPGIEELNEWLAMATSIWNNTPQPDRGFLTALEMAVDGALARERKAVRVERKRIRKRRRR